MRPHVRNSARLGIATIAVVLAAGCGEGTPEGDASPDSEVSTSTAPSTSTPTAEDLAAALLTGEELEQIVPVADVDARGGWRLPGYFATWPHGSPGVIPQDERSAVKPLEALGEICPAANGSEAGFSWDAHTGYGSTPGGDQHVATFFEWRLGDDPSQVEATFDDLREMLASCVGLGTTLDGGEFSIDAVQVPEVGDDQYAVDFHGTLTADTGTGDGATITMTSSQKYVIVRDGAVLTLVALWDSGPELFFGDDDVDAILTASIDKAP